MVTCIMFAPPCLLALINVKVRSPHRICQLLSRVNVSQTHDRGASFGRHQFPLNGSWQKPMNKTKTWQAEWDWALECLCPSCPGWVIAVTVCVWIQKQINMLSSVEQVSTNPLFSALYPFTDFLCTLFSASSFYFWFSEDSKVDLGPLWVISLPHCHADSLSSAVFHEDNTAYKTSDESSKQKTLYENQMRF